MARRHNFPQDRVGNTAVGSDDDVVARAGAEASGPVDNRSADRRAIALGRHRTTKPNLWRSDAPNPLEGVGDDLPFEIMLGSRRSVLQIAATASVGDVATPRVAAAGAGLDHPKDRTASEPLALSLDRDFH